MFKFKKYNFSISSDEELMHFVSKGDEKAFNEIYKRYSKKMLYFFYVKFVGDKEKANDLLQDLFLKLIEKPIKFDVSRKFSTWIYSVANNMCKNEFKKNNLNESMLVSIAHDLNDSDSKNILNNNDYSYFNEQLIKSLANLDQDQSTTFILRYNEHLSIKEISKIMDCSEGTVKSRLFYTLKKLSISLKEFDPKQ